MDDRLRRQMLARAEATVNALARWAHDHPTATLEQREEQVLGDGRRLLAVLLTLLASTPALRRPGRCPHCGHWDPAPLARQRPRTLLSRLGLLRLPRERFTCAQCTRDWQPLDWALGLQPRQRMTAGVRRWLLELGLETSFRGAAQLLQSLTGLAVAAETVRQHTQRVGRALEQAQQAAIARVEQTQEAAAPVVAAPGQLLVQTDGLMLRFLDGWHEVKLGLVGGCQDGELVQPSYVAARESAERFGPRLLAEAARRGALEVVAWQSGLVGAGLAVLRRVAVLGDGAAWIWHLAAEHFGERTEIVDYFHATEHVWSLAHTCYGEGSGKAQRWAQRQCQRLRERGPEPLLRALRAVKHCPPEVAVAVRREQGYFRNNAARMAYPTFRRQGLPIGSGPVESAAKHLVQQRMKRAGMRWSTPGAAALLALRAYTASDRPLAHLLCPLAHLLCPAALPRAV